MKKCTRILALLLALVLTLGLAVTAYADGTTTGTGTITIDNAVGGQTYAIYEILYLESYDKGAGAYAYKATDAWKNFINSNGIKDTYVSVDNQGYVTWVKDAQGNNADAAAFAKLALAYAKENGINATATKVASGEGTTTVVFDKLDLGYYLLDSSLGTLCSLDTTNPSVTIEEKNAVPTNEKKVEEDSNNTYGNVNDADIGQTVNFKSTITAQAGAENYVFHDKMSAGLTFGDVTGVTLNGNAVAAENYTVKTADFADDCTFEVAFTQAFCDTLKANDEIVISYTATLNSKAVVGVDGNPNESKIEYGEKGKTTTTPASKTTTYTWGFDVLKFANGDENKKLSGAEFVLLDKDAKKVATVVNGKLTGWEVVPAAGEDGTINWPENTKLTTDENGSIKVDGLDADTYKLREIKAPDGYNKLDKDHDFTITAETAEDGKTMTYTRSTQEINNQSGTELPSTGGMGTTIFYVLGGILAVGAAVLLVTKKRMERA